MMKLQTSNLKPQGNHKPQTLNFGFRGFCELGAWSFPEDCGLQFEVLPARSLV
jgi:hypothetical protein